jgi:hypothetical protein
MLMCNQAVLNKAGVPTARPAEVAVLPTRPADAMIIKTLEAALVWRACGQSGRK